MTKRYRKSDDSSGFSLPGGIRSLPTDEPIAVYYRQSNLAQVGNISTSMQTVDMVEVLKQRGWAEENIILIDMDEGISGSTKIDERPGMRRLFDLISQRLVGAVACQDEDRLFRDVTQIQVNIFIEACKTTDVMVLTPTAVYDFANPLSGTNDARIFRFKCDMAAEYINSVIRGRLHRAKMRLLMEGRWGGSGMPPGFMVDLRKTLPDGSRNENWRRFTPFDPYAEVVKEYFKLFLDHSGNIRATQRHIAEHGPYYPDPEVCIPPEGFKVVYRFKHFSKGYYPTRTGLAGILTHAAYIGHWIVRGQIVRWNNHPAIISEDLFFKAFNYLSAVTLEGEPNPDYHPNQPNTRPSLDSSRPADRPLFAGMVYSQYDGEWRKVGTQWVGPLEHYSYTFLSPSPLSEYVWSKAAEFLDDLIISLLLEKLRATFDQSVWQHTLDTFADKYRESRKQMYAQLQHLERVMENLTTSLETLSNPIMIRTVEQNFEDAQAEYNRLTRELDSADREQQELDALKDLRESCGPALENWDSLTRNEQRVVANAFITRIEATPVEEHGLQLDIVWRDGSIDSKILPRQSTTGTQWLPSEVETLREMMEDGASQVEIASTFPHRTWDQIRNKLYGVVGVGDYHFEVTPIRGDEDYQAFLDRTSGNTMPYQAGSGDRWKAPAIRRLNDMLDDGATKLELLEAFPYRTWGRIRAKVTELRGKDWNIPGPKPMRRHETFELYQMRIKENPNDGVTE